MNFYACIIGTELLNGRREDAHFPFLRAELVKRGFELKASFIIKDDPAFMKNVFSLIKSDPESVMFCFGGIGATPDDYTRDVAASVFSGGEMAYNTQAYNLIVERFQDRAYPDRIKMAYFPKNAGVLTNVVNKIPGFYVDERFFFTPGFPDMAHPMVCEALDLFFTTGKPKFSKTFTVYSTEGDLMDIMKTLPDELEFSSLPIMDGDARATEIYLASAHACVADDCYEHFVTLVEKKGLQWRNGGYYDEV